MTTFPNVATTTLFFLFLHLQLTTPTPTSTWCVARTDATPDALQAALDFACGAGADCEPLQQTGQCFLPNTVQAHASYAFNSYYMHLSMDPAACDFAGTATLAKTDPSYGSCVYPASPSTAGVIKNPPLDATLPPPQNGAPLVGSEGALTPPQDMGGNAPNGTGGAYTPTGMAPVLDDSSSSEAFSVFLISRLLFMGMIFVVLFLKV
ncbi:hypothetical protein QVD17_37707 [Tagetes erecta]|uniref:X8 domain-containing protein n=1 Tax=Tagetes erecta TaxID=13708 RepID=A0AAD8JYS8_TARER|nr:hypothetical protein QVD17_37707 [Tagetes erecta]